MNSPKLIILGAGESGASAARLGKREGFAVFVSDAGAGNPTHLAELDEAGIAYETGGHTEARILEADEVVKSPGIPDTAPLIVKLRAAGIPVISEIEFAGRYVDPRATIVAITGSNGKTTTTLLTHHLLSAGGTRALAGGNLGESFARLLLDRPVQEVYVLELSSFQLDGIVDFRPHIAAVLNITPDHLDRYDYELTRYADSKLSIAARQRSTDLLLVLEDSEVIAPALRRKNPASRLLVIDPKQATRGSEVTVAGKSYELAGGKLRGRHNALNARFALRIATELGLPQEALQQALDTFEPAPHRMETVATTDGRTWINDSKATNIDSTYFALEAITQPTVWIAGGTDKGNDYTALAGVIGHVHTLICMGVDNRKLIEAFSGRIDRIVESDGTQTSVQLADRYAGAGNTVLLSPACASFDLFKNYIDRGDQFRSRVKSLYA